MPYDLMKYDCNIDHETITEDNLKKGQRVHSMREKLDFQKRIQPSLD